MYIEKLNTMCDKSELRKPTKKFYHVGNLNKKVIDLLNLDINEGKILFDIERLKHIEEHKNEFGSEEEFYHYLELIPEIISNPDYVGLHPDGTNIRYIKIYNKTTVLAVRISHKNVFWIKTFFAITEAKLKAYIESGLTKKVD